MTSHMTNVTAFMCHVISSQLAVQFHRKKRAPCEMKRGSATTDEQFAYFAMTSTSEVSTTDGKSIYLTTQAKIYRHEWSTAKWEELPPSPSHDTGLVIIDGELTAVGGQEGSRYTNKLFTLRQGQWVEHYPPMNTEISSPAVVSTSDGNYIVVIGEGDKWTTTVDVFHVKTRKWCELKTYLPPPLNSPSATICGNQSYVIGYYDIGYSCSLQALLSSDQPPNIVKWTSLPQAPVKGSTAATLCGQLVIIGGLKQEDTVRWNTSELPVNSIHQLVDGQWVEIGSMSDGRNMCFIVTPSPNRMMIVGGRGYNYRITLDSVEECVVV